QPVTWMTAALADEATGNSPGDGIPLVLGQSRTGYLWSGNPDNYGSDFRGDQGWVAGGLPGGGTGQLTLQVTAPAYWSANPSDTTGVVQVDVRDAAGIGGIMTEYVPAGTTRQLVLTVDPTDSRDFRVRLTGTNFSFADR